MTHILSFLYIHAFIATCLYNKRLLFQQNGRVHSFTVQSGLSVKGPHIDSVLLQMTPDLWRRPHGAHADRSLQSLKQVPRESGPRTPGAPASTGAEVHDRRRLLPSLSPLETVKRQVGTCDWDMEYIFMLHTYREGLLWKARLETNVHVTEAQFKKKIILIKYLPNISPNNMKNEQYYKALYTFLIINLIPNASPRIMYPPFSFLAHYGEKVTWKSF